MNEQKARAVVAESLATLQQSNERLGMALAMLFERTGWPEDVEAFFHALVVTRNCLVEALERNAMAQYDGIGLEAVVLPHRRAGCQVRVAGLAFVYPACYNAHTG